MFYVLIDNGNFVKDTIEPLGFEKEWLEQEVQKKEALIEEVIMRCVYHAIIRKKR